MKKIILILIVSSMFFLTSCEEDGIFCPSVPSPAGTPDDTTTYDGGGGYKTVSYIYYCWNGKYRSITWTRTQKCGSWTKSEYTSNCI